MYYFKISVPESLQIADGAFSHFILYWHVSYFSELQIPVFALFLNVQTGGGIHGVSRTVVQGDIIKCWN